jgi:hypothetical protein
VRLSKAYQGLWLEAAQLRFRLNFGTHICDRCDGLKAGPGVVATCYQIRQCYYDNIREGEGTPKQKRVIESLLEPQNNLTPNKR